MTPITHIARLPLGFTAEFRWTPPNRVDVMWQPHVPNSIRSPRQRAKFLRAYTAERDAFMELIAHTLGGGGIVVDVDNENLGTVTLIRPPTRQ